MRIATVGRLLAVTVATGCGRIAFDALDTLDEPGCGWRYAPSNVDPCRLPPTGSLLLTDPGVYTLGSELSPAGDGMLTTPTGAPLATAIVVDGAFYVFSVDELQLDLLSGLTIAGQLPVVILVHGSVRLDG